MQNIPQRIELIESLLAHDTVEFATYAALECRSTIEAICYDRFKALNRHLALADLRKWQPRDVIRQIIEDGNAEAAKGLVLSIGKPIDPTFVGPVRLQDLEYIELGTQTELRDKVLARLHNALSNVALHVQLPTPDTEASVYGDKEKIKEKVKEALQELERIAPGNLLVSGIGPDTRFECECGSTISRMTTLLKDGQVVSCNRIDCTESYEASYRDRTWWFTRRARLIPCESCGKPRSVLMLRPSKGLAHDFHVVLE